MVLDCYNRSKHLLVEGVVTTGYRNTCLRETSSIPSYAAKQAKDKKLYADKASANLASMAQRGPHVLVTFTMKDGRRLRAHAKGTPLRSCVQGCQGG
jgi:hypothetical protein